jgi:hypothetical protein
MQKGNKKIDPIFEDEDVDMVFLDIDLVYVSKFVTDVELSNDLFRHTTPVLSYDFRKRITYLVDGSFDVQEDDCVSCVLSDGETIYMKSDKFHELVDATGYDLSTFEPVKSGARNLH